MEPIEEQKAIVFPDYMDIDSLLRHRGYGVGESRPEKVELLIIGNESGTDGKPLDVFLKEIHVPAQNRQVASDAEDNTYSSPFLKFIKRLSLFMNDGDPKWLQSQLRSLHPEDYKKVTCNWSGDNVQLIDIRPLPRPNEKQWPYDAYNINRATYLAAFDSLNSDAGQPYGDWVKQRKTYLNQQVASYPNLKYIIAPGAVAMKRTFLESCFSFNQTFKPLNFESPKKKMKTFWINELNDGRIKVCVCPFFNYYLLGLDGLSYMATEILKVESLHCKAPS